MCCVLPREPLRVVPLTITRWPFRHVQARRQGPVTYTTTGDATASREVADSARVTGDPARRRRGSVAPDCQALMGYQPEKLTVPLYWAFRTETVYRSSAVMYQ